MIFALTVAWIICPPLLKRSIAPYAPFQLPLKYTPSELYEFVDLIRAPPYNMNATLHDNWLYVDVNTCASHMCLLRTFGCVK